MLCLKRIQSARPIHTDLASRTVIRGPSIRPITTRPIRQLIEDSLEGIRLGAEEDQAEERKVVSYADLKR